MKVRIATALRWLADRLAPVPTPVQVTNTTYLDGNEIQKDLFQAMSVPTPESPQAKAALAAAGLLGPAGSGVSAWKTPVRHVLKIGDKP